MDEVLTIRMPKGSRRLLRQLATLKHQNLRQYLRDAIESKLWTDALDETAHAVETKARALGIRNEEDVFKRCS